MTSYVSVSTAAYDGCGFDTILPSLSRCGVQHVEFAFIDGYVEAFTYRDFTTGFATDLNNETQCHGQESRYFSGPIDLGHEDAAARLEARCCFAAYLGASYVITNAASQGCSDTFFKQADHLAAIARQYDVRILRTPATAFPIYSKESRQIMISMNSWLLW